MPYRTLGGTGLRVSAIGVGTWQLAGPLTLDGRADGFPEIGRDNAVRLIRECGDLGVNLIDCAEIYGDGEGERRVGEAIRGQRERWIICTKGGMGRGPDGRRVRDFSAAGVAAAVERSLVRLSVERLDLYLLHSPADRNEVRAAMPALARMRDQGKVRFCGVSTNDAALIRAAAEAGPVDAVLFSHSLLTPNDSVRRLIGDMAIGGLARGVFEGGLLGSRQSAESQRFSPDDIRAQRDMNAETSKLQPLRDACGGPAGLSEAAIRYSIGSDGVHAALLGARSIEAYHQAIDAISKPTIESAERKMLESMARQVRPAHARRGWMSSAGRLVRRAFGR